MTPGAISRARDFLQSAAGEELLLELEARCPKLEKDTDTIEQAALRAKNHAGFRKAIDFLLALARGESQQQSETSGHRDVR